jgi:putative SOS response-associated peptidase YedK
MCGRFQLSVKGKQISERFNVEVFDDLYKPNYNCAPSQKLSVITNNFPEKISFLKWGLIPFWAKDPKVGFRNINTRVETINEKPSFKNAFKKRRCLIPANGFYEWNKDKVPYRIFLKNEEIFAIAGIYEKWKDAEGKEIDSFSIITTSANDAIKDIHHRMPVILKPEDEKSWLFENDERVLLGLLAPIDKKNITSYPISKEISKPSNNSPGLIIPVDSTGGQQSLFV